MRIVDLFSGAGGLTFGFYYRLENGNFVRTDNEFVFANEYDNHAAKAFKANYPDIKMINRKIQDLTEDEINEMIGDQEVDIIIGGPPCQGFSLLNKNRVGDKRRELWQYYIEVVRLSNASVVVMENVPQLLTSEEYDEIVEYAASLGFSPLAKAKLCAADFRSLYFVCKR